MSEGPKADSYWESKVDKYTSENTRKSSGMDVTVITALRRNMKQMAAMAVKESSEDIAYYIERRKKLLSAQQTLISPASNKSRILASLVPDEVIYNPNDYNTRHYVVALMFADVSGFTELCESYTTKVEDGTSAMTQILNSYIGSMVQEIVMHGGDLLKFSGDAFLAMWKTSQKVSLMQAVQTAIDCGLIIQRDYGAVETDVGIVLKVKVAISAGDTIFSLLGDTDYSHWVIVGQPVWDVKIAEMISKAGDVIVAQSAWKYMNASRYVVKRMQDDMHAKIIGLSSTWRNVILHNTVVDGDEEAQEIKSVQNRSLPTMSNRDFFAQSIDTIIQMYTDTTLKSYRPSVSYAMQNNFQAQLSKYIPSQILKTVDADEPLESITEMRYVIIVFLNIIPHMREEQVLIEIVKEAFNIVTKTLPEYQGVLDKVSMFDKDLVCLAVFGLRGFKHELNVQQALSCSAILKSQLSVIKHVDHVSIGVTAGFAYCGIVGHVMRREMTVIGMCVNKGARLMVAYPDRITCDKEVFLQSQLPSSHFVHVIHKDLKGFTNVGPIYEYLEKANMEATICASLIGRDNEIKMFQSWVRNVVKDHKNRQYVKNLLIIEGQLRVGKTRFVEEILKYLPKDYPMIKMAVDKANIVGEYSVIKTIIMSAIQYIYPEHGDMETKIINLLTNTVPRKYWCLLNPILDTKFIGRSEVVGHAEKEKLIKDVFIKLCLKVFRTLHFLVFDRSGEMDDSSLDLISLMLEKLPVAAIMVIHTQKLLQNEILLTDAKKPRALVIHIDGVDRWHHATIVCQLMKVDAISSELEKVVQISSEGYVSWIEKFIRIMIHSKQLNIVEMTKKEVLSMGAIISLDDDTRALNKTEKRDSQNSNTSKEWLNGWEIFRSSYRATDLDSRRSVILEKMRVAILNPSYKFEDMQIEATSYVIFLKTYDNMAGFEKLVLKCSSAMGEIFHTSLLIQVLRAEKEETIIRGILKLFDLGIFEFIDKEYLNHKTLVNIHKSDTSLHKQDRDAVSLYLRNAYIRFRDSVFFKYGYDLLTENQKKHYHNIAISILRSSIRKCDSCGGGPFNMILGVKRRDVFNEKQDAREKMNEYFKNGGFHFKYFNKNRISQLSEVSSGAVSTSSGPINLSMSETSIANLKYLSNCECEALLSAMYTQIIRHCKKSEKVQSLIEAYLEFIDLKISFSDVNEAIVIINEADEFVKSPKFKLPDNNPRILSWQKNFIEGRIASKKGKVMYEFGNLPEAEKYLYEAMALFEYPFPKNQDLFQIKYMREKYKHRKLLKTHPEMYLGKPTGVAEIIHNHVSETLYYLYDYFMTVGKYKEAHLAAVWSFNTILKSNTEFHLICAASANMISLGIQRVQWNLCSQIEELSMNMCIKKRNNLDITDIHSYIQLITSILLFRLTKADIDTSIKIGQKLITILSFMKADFKLLFAMATLGGMLSAKKMFRALLAYFTEIKSIQHVQDFICKTFYYASVIDVYLDTGYWLESYTTCYTYFLENRDEMYSNKHMDPGCAMRSKQWDLISEWKATYRKFLDGYHLKCKYPMTLLRFLEAQLLYLVYQIQEKSAARCRKIRKVIEDNFKRLDKVTRHDKSYRVGVDLLKGYYCHINGDNHGMLQYMEKGLALANELEYTLLIDHYTFLTKTLDECHKEGKIYEWTGISYRAEITILKAKLRTQETFSTIISDL